MKRFFYILLLIACPLAAAQAQVTLEPVQSDPVRQHSSLTQKKYLQKSNAIVAGKFVPDTLRLPFFEDFASPAVPVKEILNVSGQDVEVVNYGLHGLKDKDSVFYGNVKDTADRVKDSSGAYIPALSKKKFYIKRTGPYTFKLYLDNALTNPLTGTGERIVDIPDYIGGWRKFRYQTSSEPDSLKWMPGGGTYVNNRYCLDPPSYNAATFDGLNGSGVPYSPTNPYQKGAADSLTSLPIDLSGYRVKDSLVLSFYWQGGGIGESPNASDGDSLRLQFKDRNNNWRTVWAQPGDSTKFLQTLIKISDSASYFHKGFQFSFQSFGRLSGTWDIWNVDYIHLDKGRSVSNDAHPDLAIIRNPESILKRYTAMPYKQYFNSDLTARAAETQTTSAFKIGNLDNDPQNLNQGKSYLMDAENNIFLDSLHFYLLSNNNKSYNTSVPGGLKPRLLFDINPANIVAKSLGPVTLKYHFQLNSPNSILYGVNYLGNDTISGYTYLHDYYAYDDSTAEYGAGINVNSGSIAIQYATNIADSVVAVDIFFPQMGKNLSGQGMLLTLWSSLQPSQPLYSQTVGIKYTGINKYTRFLLDQAVPVNGIFYVGYKQTTDVNVPIGFDKNTDASSHTFMNLAGQWESFTDQGTFMIRPVMKSSSSITTGLLPRHNRDGISFEVFPNPTSGDLAIVGEINKATVVDISGRQVLEASFRLYDEKHMDLSTLPAGIYFLHVYNNSGSGVKKVVVVK